MRTNPDLFLIRIRKRFYPFQQRHIKEALTVVIL